MDPGGIRTELLNPNTFHAETQGKIPLAMVETRRGAYFFLILFAKTQFHLCVIGSVCFVEASSNTPQLSARCQPYHIQLQIYESLSVYSKQAFQL